jgi:hypothetical protein
MAAVTRQAQSTASGRVANQGRRSVAPVFAVARPGSSVVRKKLSSSMPSPVLETLASLHPCPNPALKRAQDASVAAGRSGAANQVVRGASVVAQVKNP